MKSLEGVKDGVSLSMRSNGLERKSNLMKKIVCILLVLMSILSFPLNALANETGNNEAQLVETKDNNGYYVWEVYSVTRYDSDRYYTPYREGPSAHGGTNGVTISVSNTLGYNYSITNTISGSYASIANISAAMGITIGVSRIEAGGVTTTVPPGKWYMLVYRPYFYKYKVVEKQYYVEHTVKTCVDTKTSYVMKFINWDHAVKDLDTGKIL